MSSIPLRIAFLWHNHQPYYEKDGEFILPWLRFHAVKDYSDLFRLLDEFPNINQTLNIVPSVFLQIEEYLTKGTKDIVQKLTLIPAEKLTKQEKQKILDLFFICNENNLIRPNWRYYQLYEIYLQDSALEKYSIQDWLDLQVWYNLAWLGEYSKSVGLGKRLYNKGYNFTEIEKVSLLELHDEIMASIIPLYKRLHSFGQLELSTTPFYHPILPLLINSEIAKEANPGNLSVEPVYIFPEDAVRQIELAIEAFEGNFNHIPNGFWPAEGSISDDTISIFIDKKIQWLATDELVLKASESLQTGLEKYFPRKFSNSRGDIVIFFRDNILSDKIGFQYSNWLPEDAVSNFINSLTEIRNSIIQTYGEESLKFAVVPIILDGENCWEFYPQNGFEFLRKLYSELSFNTTLKTIKFSDAIFDQSPNYLNEINHIQAGSWINANFNIWAGHLDDIAAWNMLSKVRFIFEEKKENLNIELVEKIYNKILIAEGSDWFWWYGPEHNAPNKNDFDVLFRWHIKEIYNLMGEKVPEDIFLPIGSIPEPFLILPQKRIGISELLEENKQLIGKFEFRQNFSTMHQSGKPNVTVYFGNDESYIYFRPINFYGSHEEKILSIQVENVNETFYSNKCDENSIIKIHFSEINNNSEAEYFSISFKLINLADKSESFNNFKYKIF